MISLEYCAAGPYRVTAYRLPQYPTSPPSLAATISLTASFLILKFSYADIHMFAYATAYSQ